MKYSDEIQRKAIHLTSVYIPIGYYFLSKNTVLQILIPLLIFCAFADIIRITNKPIGRFYQKWVGHMFREHENRHLSGATFLFLGAVLTILLFDKLITITVLSFLIVSDAFASLFGQRWGKRKILNNKTLEGSLAFFVTSLVIIYLIPELDPVAGITGALAATIFELLPLKIDDNLIIPLGSGVVIHLTTLLMISL